MRLLKFLRMTASLNLICLFMEFLCVLDLVLSTMENQGIIDGLYPQSLFTSVTKAANKIKIELSLKSTVIPR